MFNLISCNSNLKYILIALFYQACTWKKSMVDSAALRSYKSMLIMGISPIQNSGRVESVEIDSAEIANT